MLRDEVTIERVTELSDFPEVVPSDHSDWAGMTSHTRLTLQEEYIFEESGIAVVDETYDHSYQFITTGSVRRFKDMQDEVGWFEDAETNSEGIVADADDGREKYTLHGCIRSLLHTIITDGRRHGDPSSEDITVEYTKHNSLNRYTILIKWS